MLTTLLAYLLVGVFFLIDRYVRQGSQAKSLERGQYDRGSTTFLTVSFGVSTLALLAAPLLNHFQLGHFPFATQVGWTGVVIMGLSLALRVWANRTLGAFYTRTLRVVEGQHLVQSGPYRLIRHPGYLGLIMLWTGASLAVMNWIATLVIVVSMAMTYHYRMNTEETMLAATLGEEYRAYQSRTWRLIPFVY